MKSSKPLPILPGAVLLALVFVWPTLGLFRTAFNEVGPTGAMVETWSLKTATETFADGFTVELTLNSLQLSLSATAITASAYAFGVRFKVETKTLPPGRTSVPNAWTIAVGSGTCSSISMQVTMSYWPARSRA